jgi:hypothetical protein
VSAFESYLKAAGFCFGDAHLDFQEEGGTSASGESGLTKLTDALNDFAKSPGPKLNAS